MRTRTWAEADLNKEQLQLKWNTPHTSQCVSALTLGFSTEFTTCKYLNPDTKLRICLGCVRLVRDGTLEVCEAPGVIA